MEVTPSGMSTLVRLGHTENALLPMEVTLSGMSTLVRSEQFQNASLPMEVTVYFTPSFVTVAGMVITLESVSVCPLTMAV